MSTPFALPTPTPLPDALTAEADALAAQFALAPDSMRALALFLHRTFVEDDTMRAHFLAATSAERGTMLQTAVTRWHTQTRAFLEELRDNTTARAQAVRDAILDEVYATLRARRGQA